MPSYEYTCMGECNTQSTLFRSVEDRDKPVFCQECGNIMVRTISAPPIHFKGTGFYKTGG